MKKRTKRLLAAFCATFMITAGAGCAVSAYELAVKNGYEGDESAWLETLKGEDGKDGQDLTAATLYEAAKANGYEGSYIEFCRDVLEVDVKENKTAVNMDGYETLPVAEEKTEENTEKSVDEEIF